MFKHTYIYPGALHIHTRFSHDSPGELPDIVTAARKAGLKWIIITDHDTLECRSYEGWHDGVLVIVGCEITPDHNHILALGTERLTDKNLSPQDMLNDIYRQGGFGILAHPDDRVTNGVKKRFYAWDDWTIDGPSERDGHTVGLELWNLLSDWSTNLTSYNKYISFFRLRQNLKGPTIASLQWWDRLNMAGKHTVAVAGLDAHAIKKRTPWGSTVEVFSYYRSFHTLTNYVLLDTPLDSHALRAQHQILTAIKQGRLFFANRLDGEPSHVTFEATRNDTQWTIGDTLSLDDGPFMLKADVQQNVEVHLIHNGRIHTIANRGLYFCIDEPGIYRMEVYHRSGRPWIFTNPLFIKRS